MTNFQPRAEHCPLTFDDHSGSLSASITQGFQKPTFLPTTALGSNEQHY